MIWGIQWDETLKWLIDTGEKTYAKIASNSTSWGSCYDNSFTCYTNTSKSTATKVLHSYTIIPSGAYEGANANNVYDLAGNVLDLTQESDGSNRLLQVLSWWLLLRRRRHSSGIPQHQRNLLQLRLCRFALHTLHKVALNPPNTKIHTTLCKQNRNAPKNNCKSIDVVNGKIKCRKMAKKNVVFPTFFIDRLLLLKCKRCYWKISRMFQLINELPYSCLVWDLSLSG